MKFKRKNIRIENKLFGICGILVIIAYTHPEPILNEIILFLGSIILIDGLFFLLLVPSIEVKEGGEIYVQSGNLFKHTISIQNKAYLISPYIHIIPRSSDLMQLVEDIGEHILLGPKKKFRVDIMYQTQYCGKQSIHQEEILLRSFMGFFNSKLETKVPPSIYILPRITSISYLECIESSLYKESNLLNYRGTEDGKIGQMEEIGYDSIPYLIGESIKLINWKIVAQKNEYWMREREKTKSTQTKYHFILSPIYYEAYTSYKERSKWITSYISIVAYYLMKYQDVKISYYKKGRWKSSYIKDLKGLDELRKKLADYYQKEELEPTSLSLLPIEKGNLERRIIICYLPEKEWLQADKGHSISEQYMVCTGPLKDIVDERMIGYITDEYCLVKPLG